jgi:hypothetical protein
VRSPRFAHSTIDADVDAVDLLPHGGAEFQMAIDGDETDSTKNKRSFFVPAIFWSSAQNVIA